MKSFKTLLGIEAKLVLRSLDVVIFGLIFPIGLAAFFGVLANGNQESLGQSFSSVIAIGICATGLMGLPLTISDYRDKKILKHFKVTPTDPKNLLIIQFILTFATALLSFIVISIMYYFFFEYRMVGNIGLFVIGYLLVTVMIYSIGIFIASISANIKQANLLCTIVYFPMIFFSGATIPYEIMPKAMQNIVDFLPLTSGIKTLKYIALNESLNSLYITIVVLVVLACILIAVSIKIFKWE